MKKFFLGLLIGTMIPVLLFAALIDYSQYYFIKHIDKPHNSEMMHLIDLNGFKLPKPVDKFIAMGYFNTPMLNLCSNKTITNPKHYGYGMTQANYHDCDRLQRYLNQYLFKE